MITRIGRITAPSKKRYFVRLEPYYLIQLSKNASAELRRQKPGTCPPVTAPLLPRFGLFPIPDAEHSNYSG